MRLLVAALSLLLLTLGIVRNAWPWIVDDAFISLRYAERFVAGDGLTWTDGEAVEGYSNLAWVLLCAALGWLAHIPPAALVIWFLVHFGALPWWAVVERRP